MDKAQTTTKSSTKQ